MYCCDVSVIAINVRYLLLSSVNVIFCYSVCLVQPCLVLQLSVPPGGRISLEVGVVDGSGSRRRIHLSNSVRELSSSPLHARVPLHSITEAKVCITLNVLKL